MTAFFHKVISPACSMIIINTLHFQIRTDNENKKKVKGWCNQLSNIFLLIGEIQQNLREAYNF